MTVRMQYDDTNVNIIKREYKEKGYKLIREGIYINEQDGRYILMEFEEPGQLPIKFQSQDNKEVLNGMTKEEIIFQLLLSLNKGNCGYISDRVYHAKKQYEILVEEGIIKE